MSHQPPGQPGDGPIRTCVGCRRREPAAALLRVVAEAGTLVPDPRHRLPGRGAWLHPGRGCLDAAERRRAFGRALRLTGSVDGDRLREFVTALDKAEHDGDAPGTTSQPRRSPDQETREQVDPS